MAEGPSQRKHRSFPVLFMILAMLSVGMASVTCNAAAGSSEVRVGSELEFPPYAFVDESGQPAGFSIELIKAVADAMGLSIKISTGPWDTVWNDLRAGRLDVLPIVAKLPERTRLVDFSVPHTETYDAFFVRKGDRPFRNIEAARGREIVVMRSDAAHHALLERNFPGRLIFVETIPEGLSLISSGKHDAFLCSKLIGTMAIKKHGLKGLTAGPPIPDYKRIFSFAVKKGDAELLEKLNQGLLIVKTKGEYDRIYEKWLAADDPWLKWKKYLLPVIAVVTVVALIAGFWLVLLQLLVKKRTRELAERNEMLRQAREELEERVAQRTAELTRANTALQTGIVERERAEEKIRRHNMVLDGINRIFQEVLSLRTDEELGETCLSVAEEVTGSRLGFIGEIGPDGLLQDIAISNPGWERCSMKDKTGHRRPPGSFHIHGVYGKVLKDGKGFFTNDPSSHPDRVGLPAGHPSLTAFLGVPLVHEGRTIGMIAVGNRDGGYGREQQETLEALAPAIVEAFKRKRAEHSLQKAHTELAAANKELEAFAYSVSHDLRAPLRVIEGFSRAIEEEEADRLSDPGKDYVRRVHAATYKMEQFIDALLSLSRLSRDELNRTPTHLSEVARSVVEDLRRDEPARQVEWVIPDNITAEGDSTMLRIVIMNLLQNAWKFTSKRETARIELGITHKDGETIYYVRDNGTGFDMAYANKLFTAFQRLHSAEEFPGIGIGLATVQRIIHRHGGRIWAESNVDKGATFYFTLK